MTVRQSLILSGSIGKGHDVVGEACAAALIGHGVDSDMLDCMSLLGRGAGAAGDWVFRKMLSLPAVYDAFHFTQLRGNGSLGRWADAAALDRLYPNVQGAVERTGANLLVSVFATGAGAAARLKSQSRPDIHTIVVMTDSFAHRMWVHEGTDLFLVTSTLAAASVRRYLPGARIEVVTAPVRPAFYSAPDRQTARKALGVPPDAACVLLMSGAWGIGPLDETAKSLAKSGAWVLAVGGSNANLTRRLMAVARAQPTVRAFGFTDRVPELMAAADVVVTSSGDTCREARVIGRGLILLDVVPGHGRENLMHELELGGSAVCEPTPDGVVGAVRTFLAGEDTSDSPSAMGADVWEDEFVAALRRTGVSFAY
jgi:UDP-N-acetylglucosamine:LPS N-acetylglucosamine transferase